MNDMTQTPVRFGAGNSLVGTVTMPAQQVPATAAAFSTRITTAAWKNKPSYAIVSTDDRALSPDLQRWMYKRAGAKVTEVKGSHLVYISQPEAVAKVIIEAAQSAQ